MYDDKFYDAMADAYRKRTPWTQLRLEQVQKMVNPQPEDRIIDLGCGMGTISHFCATFNAEVVGIDLSAKAIETAQRLFSNPLITFYQRDAANLIGLADASFDKAVSADLVEHIPQLIYSRMTQETWRVLKPGGTFFIYTPNPTHIIERLKAHNFILKQNPTHIDLKPKARLIATLETAGFDIVKAYFTASFIPVFKTLERLLMPLPLLGPLFQYRTCILAHKPETHTRKTTG